MKRNGKTSAGRQRWRCRECGASGVHSNDTSARDLATFVSWLLSKGSQGDMPGGGRSFRRRTEGLWAIWPMPEFVDEVHRVVYVDGIWLARDLCVLIACSDEHVLTWRIARAETTRAWRALMRSMAPPEMVVTDGGSGFMSAVAAEWPGTRVQRCTFHVFCQVRRCTTSRPRLLAGKELYILARDLLAVRDLRQADLWVERFLQWCEFWSDFLEERTRVDGRWEYTHERLRKARRSLARLVNAGTLFAYLDPDLAAEGPLPATNNSIEGGVNARLREMLRNHRGLSETRRVKAVYWWCYMHTEAPLPFPEILERMPTDADVELLRDVYGEAPGDGPAEWGDGVVWSEFHAGGAYSRGAE